MNIGRKIYYDKITGQVIVDTGERSGDVRDTTQEEDFLIYSELSIRNPETVGVIKLNFGQHAEDFSRGFLDRIDPVSKQLYFSYPDPTEPGGITQPQPSLTEQITALQSENAALLLQISALEADNKKLSKDQALLLLNLTIKGIL